MKANMQLPSRWLVVGTTVIAFALASTWFGLKDDGIGITGSRRLMDIFTSDAVHGKTELEPSAVLPLSTREIVGFLLAVFGLILAAGGGVGGGGFLVPIYILIFRFAPKHAIPLSNVTVFGGAVANTILNVSKRHPLADRPLIDWDIIVLMEPLTVVGALLGANVSKLLPDVVIVVMLDILLVFTAMHTLRKAKQLYQKENMMRTNSRPNAREEDDTRTAELTDGELTEPSSPVHLTDEEDAELLGDDRHCAGEGYGALLEVRVDFDPSIEGLEAMDPIVLLQKVIAEERRVPWWNIKVMVTMFLVVLCMTLLKGGSSLPSVLGVQCGSFASWMTQLSIVACALVVSVMARIRVLDKARLKERAEYVYLPCDIQWNERSTIVYPALSCFAGLVAGMFGVGGGIVKAPLMLALGVHPAVTSATSACMILFTSFTASSAFAVFGLLIPDFAGVFVVMGFVTTLFGQTVMFYFLEKFQRNSFIAFSIGSVVALSALGMTLESVSKMLHEDGSSVPCGACSEVFRWN